MTLSLEAAQHWLERWDRQQEYYMPDREERFDVVIDIVEEVVRRPDPLVVDLGIGPGSLAHRLVERIPAARVVGIDADPLLMKLGTAGRPDARIRTVLGDLREPGWFDSLGLDRAPDAYVSSTALHWINRSPLRDLLHRCGATIAPGGVFVDADHLYEGPDGATLDEVARALTTRRAARRASRGEEDWSQWWSAVEAAPELADLVRERAGGFAHVIDDRPTVHDYLNFLRSGGFRESGILWQMGDDRVIAGLA
ncbi:class I SAM-dependent methyltransferase [Mycobacterium sp. 21AC1]|uniref:class I SAM-dependent methyltransferase n=1 Tax=[Mycobacterium] appelbergii TaxID=2939269 RepID=UPI002938D21F|nr:class I SAM-dependent methyltransferase [Mycobacterium sp. 21AC1]MDV3125807.1 class I SAM-dependent methyltransferase [Mycobacterium sp. 21AC1]